MAKRKQNEMKEHILESLHSILMNRHSTKRLLLALKKRRQVQKQIVILQKNLFNLPRMQDQRETKTLQLGLPKNLRVGPWQRLLRCLACLKHEHRVARR